MIWPVPTDSATLVNHCWIMVQSTSWFSFGTIKRNALYGRQFCHRKQAYLLRSVDLWVRNCMNPASSLPLVAGTFSRNSLLINLHISVFLCKRLLEYLLFAPLATGVSNLNLCYSWQCSGRNSRNVSSCTPLNKF